MKSNRSLITMLALVAVLAGMYFAISLPSGGGQETDDQSASGGQYVLSDIDPMTVMHMTVAMEGREYNFKYTAYGWQVEEDPEIPLDQTTMEEMVNGLCNVTSDRKLDAGRDSFSDYGLDPAFVHVTLTDSSGNTYTYNIGDKHETSAKFYFNVEGTDEVYTVPTLVGRTFQNHPTLESLLKLSRFPSGGPANTHSFTVSYDGHTYEVVYMADGYEGCYSSDYQWFLKQGSDMLPLDGEEMTNLLNVYSSLGMQNGVAWTNDPSVLAQYGLDENYITISVNYDRNDYGNVIETFYLGKGQDGRCYGRVEGSDVIGLMVNSYDFFLFSYDKYLPLDLSKMSPATVDSMTVELEDNRYVIKAQHETSAEGEDTVSYTLNGKALDGRAMDSLFGTMRAVKAESTAPVGPSSAQPYLRITFDRNTTSDRQMTLTLWQYDSSFYLSQFNGQLLLINKRDAEAIGAAIADAVATAQ